MGHIARCESSNPVGASWVLQPFHSLGMVDLLSYQVLSETPEDDKALLR